MASTERAPRRGEVWLVALGAGRRGEPDRNRPAVIAMADPLWQGAPTDLVPVVPLSSSLAPSLLRPDVPAGNGVDRPTRAICRAVRGVAEGRLLRRLGRLDAATMAAVDLALARVLALGVRSDR